MSTETWQDVANEIWNLFRETDKQFKETKEQFKEIAKQFQETDARLTKQFQETDAKLTKQFKETDARLTKQFQETDARLTKQFQETDAKLTKQFQETDRQLDKRFKETDRQLDKRFKETSREINKLSGLFGNQWGKMIEALVRPNALKLFQDRDIKVYSIHKRVEIQIDDRTMEIDILLDSKDDVVVIEAKSHLKVNDVEDFLKKLTQLLYFFPHYEGRRVYGAMAGLDIDSGAGKYAYRQGLFVLNAIGDGIAQIKNDHKFRPTDFGSAAQNLESNKI